MCITNHGLINDLEKCADALQVLCMHNSFKNIDTITCGFSIFLFKFRTN